MSASERELSAEACITEIESAMNSNLGHRDREASIAAALAYFRRMHSAHPDPHARESRRKGDIEPYVGPARDGIEAQYGHNDTFPGDPYP